MNILGLSEQFQATSGMIGASVLALLVLTLVAHAYKEGEPGIAVIAVPLAMMCAAQMIGVALIISRK